MASLFRRARREKATEPEAAFPKGIKVLAEPPSACLDIVFVHGLTGDRKRTWTHPGSQDAAPVFWPRQLLPASLPQARIVTFGYDAYISAGGRRKQVSTNRIADHASDLINALIGLRGADRTTARPIIFVVHSLGGIVCKDALRISRDSLEIYLQNVYQSTRAIAFMGTPHSGSWLASWAKIPVKSLGIATGKRVDENLLNILDTRSEVLNRIQDTFLAMLRTREAQQNPVMITCFFEALPMIGNLFVVPPESGSILGYNRVSVHANHREMVRYRDSKDPAFIGICTLLQNWILTLTDTPQRLQASLPAPGQVQEGNSSTMSLGRSQSPGASELEGSTVAQSMDDDESFIAPHMAQAQQNAMKALAYAEMRHRQINIDDAARDTCQWLLGHPKFVAWYQRRDLDRSHGLLWIKGKPGSGKSTLMKHTFHRLGESPYSESEPHTLRICYFFSARGNYLERSPIGMYRALLHQTCSASYQARRYLGKIYDHKMQGSAEQRPWMLAELRSAFHEILALRSMPAVDIFVDALDECHDEEARKVVQSFSELATLATADNRKLRICWSSRHYPHISVRHGLELRLEALNRADITEYVRQQFDMMTALPREPSLEAELVSKSEGVFLWVVLVVRKLSKAADQGHSITKLKELVRKTPVELNDLFQAILKSLDPDLKTDTSLLVQWALFSPLQGLRLDGLQMALALSREDAPSSLNSFMSSLHGPERLDAPQSDRQAHFRRYITERSGGLLEVVSPKNKDTNLSVTDVSFDSAAAGEQMTNEDNGGLIWSRSQERDATSKFSVLNSQTYASSNTETALKDVLKKLDNDRSYVQVIHESVREFLLEAFATDSSDPSSSDQSPTDFEEESAHVLFLACSRLLRSQELSCSLSVSQSRALFADNNFPTLVVHGGLWTTHPFVAYARTHIWKLLKERRLLTRDGQEPKQPKEYKYIRETFWRWWSIELAVGSIGAGPGTYPDFFDRGAKVKTSWILWIADKQASLQKDPRHEKHILESDRVLEKARNVWLGEHSKLDDLGILELDEAISDRSCAEYFHSGWMMLAKLKIPLVGRARECAFVAAAHHGMDEAVASFVRQGVGLDCVDSRSHTALLDAINGAHVTTVSLLLRLGADPNISPGLWNSAPLFEAASSNDDGSREIVPLLIRHGAKLETRNWAGRTAAHAAAAAGNVLAIEQLSSHGADLHAQDQYLETPLFVAIKGNRTAAVNFLLRHGAEIEATNIVGNRPFIESVKCGNETIVADLLVAGAFYDAAGWSGFTALYWAADAKNEDITSLLIRAGATALSSSHEPQAPLPRDEELFLQAAITTQSDEGACQEPLESALASSSLPDSNAKASSSLSLQRGYKARTRALLSKASAQVPPAFKADKRDPSAILCPDGGASSRPAPSWSGVVAIPEAGENNYTRTGLDAAISREPEPGPEPELNEDEIHALASSIKPVEQRQIRGRMYAAADFIAQLRARI